MKKLIALIFLASALSSAAQTTNISVTLTINTGAGAITLSNSLPAVAVTGINVAYNSYKAASTNNTANFQQFTRQYLSSLVVLPLRELGNDWEMKQVNVDLLMKSILAHWDNASAADRKLLTDWLAKYPPTP